MKKPRFVEWVEEILYQSGPLTIGDLMLRLKGRGFRNLPTYKHLLHSIAKYPQFIAVGSIQVQSKLNPNHHYRVLLYGLAEGHREEE
jgi:hypothetical protein|tara:strand:- start:2123 stop:2383 length:261 start_codon:yes stop_codon:yes gene_type:complete